MFCDVRYANLVAQYLKTYPNDQNKMPGFGFSDPHELRNAWNKLPE
jgi:hypothetical protein